MSIVDKNTTFLGYRRENGRVGVRNHVIILPVDDLSTATLTSAGRSVDVLVVNLDQRLSAYRNECAHEALPLTDAVLDLTNGTLTCPWHGFCYDATSGECMSAPGAQLEQLPLRIDDGDVWVRVL